MRARLLVIVSALACGCSASAGASHPTLPVVPSPPPKDDGKAAQGGEGGAQHAAALEQLKLSKADWRGDKQNSLRVLLPDAEHWMRVKFWGVKSLVGFRYGKDHHAIVAAFVTHVEDNLAPGACTKSFESWAQPYVDAFEVDVQHDPPKAVVWNGKIADIDSVVAATATLGVHDAYAVAYGTYPAWKNACLVVGIAVPARDEIERAKDVRDRFVREVLPKIEVTKDEEPPERF
jgi:hypothetical protein